MNNSKKFDQAFTCVGNGHGAPCTPATKDEWLKMRNEPRVAELCQRIENGEDIIVRGFIRDKNLGPHDS